MQLRNMASSSLYTAHVYPNTECHAFRQYPTQTRGKCIIQLNNFVEFEPAGPLSKITEQPPVHVEFRLHE